MRPDPRWHSCACAGGRAAAADRATVNTPPLGVARFLGHRQCRSAVVGGGITTQCGWPRRPHCLPSAPPEGLPPPNQDETRWLRSGYQERQPSRHRNRHSRRGARPPGRPAAAAPPPPPSPVFLYVCSFLRLPPRPWVVGRFPHPTAAPAARAQARGPRHPRTGSQARSPLGRVARSAGRRTHPPPPRRGGLGTLHPPASSFFPCSGWGGGAPPPPGAFAHPICAHATWRRPPDHLPSLRRGQAGDGRGGGGGGGDHPMIVLCKITGRPHLPPTPLGARVLVRRVLYVQYSTGQARAPVRHSRWVTWLVVAGGTPALRVPPDGPHHRGEPPFSTRGRVQA